MVVSLWFEYQENNYKHDDDEKMLLASHDIEIRKTILLVNSLIHDYFYSLIQLILLKNKITFKSKTSIFRLHLSCSSNQ